MGSHVASTQAPGGFARSGNRFVCKRLDLIGLTVYAQTLNNSWLTSKPKRYHIANNAVLEVDGGPMNAATARHTPFLTKPRDVQLVNVSWD